MVAGVIRLRVLLARPVAGEMRVSDLAVAEASDDAVGCALRMLLTLA